MGRMNVGSFELGDHDSDWFLVMSRLGGRSVRANLSSVVAFYVRRRKAEYEGILNYTARRYGLTTDACFQRLLKGEDLGEPVEGWEPIDEEGTEE
jgi:hypothetical protein